MAIYFWISIPIDEFFQHSNIVMKKYNVSAYVELIGDKPGSRIIYAYDEHNPQAFIKCFSDPAYHRFYFSCYPFQNIDIVKELGTHSFYSTEINPFSIEGNGGVETEKTRETIHLRQILKEPDKHIKRFYLALQRKLKNIPGIQNSYIMGNHEYRNHYCLPSSKIIIPPNPHNRDIKGSWGDFYLNSIGRTE